MGNLINHKCLITKKTGSFLYTEVQNLLFQLNAYNCIYSDFYFSIDANQFKLEYIAKHYPDDFETNEFLNQYNLLDIVSDGGGSTDIMNLAKNYEKAVYEFDEIEIVGNLNKTIQLHNNQRSQTLKLKGGIKANTYNETITEISNNESKIKYCDKKLRESMLMDCLEIWEIQIDDKPIETKLMEVVRSIQPYPEDRFNNNLNSITFKNKSTPYFSIYWNLDKSTWEMKRKFDLWEILRIE